MHLTLAAAEALVIDALKRSGVEEGNSRSVARALVAAEAAGQGGHGLRRVVAYAAQAKSGKVDGIAKPVVFQPFPSVIQIDACHGYAYPAFDLAVPLLSEMARKQGIALAAIRRSHHAGVLALTVERFAEAGLVALMVANATASMAAWGGRKPVFGTNPIAFAAPVPADDPIVIDLALSRVARGKIMAARQKGASIPANWAFDRDGQPTTDAVAALEGTMVPSGEAKGAALAMMVEILAAPLAGANFSFESTSLFDDKGAAPGLGQMLIVINPEASGGSFAASRLGELAAEISSDPSVRLPGRRGQNARKYALEHGIEVEDDVIDAILTI
ncbi:Ldh family oxidoreductase [Rhizobium mongolense]|uniref:(2R)-3-sulfolactate dehydrogenase (NADP+) n=2 Tax=Rhizobium mongolense TaxID=57676 RepID=A0ABR6ISH5_9HYPH|nr:Ldh family oxidoreductase [Rhizobium mongolense]MBB4230849.1 (2R)-3-sulfolactate dehydrogenase (NADP+) [Rhizobium mongolense]TVZ66005.1 (2R)-3-sulfolactate dehydrogenase (NADP+) [Rhizobium mongolense USDA 1844]